MVILLRCKDTNLIRIKRVFMSHKYFLILTHAGKSSVNQVDKSFVLPLPNWQKQVTDYRFGTQYACTQFEGAQQGLALYRRRKL